MLLILYFLGQGCSTQKDSEEIKSVSWYQEHHKAREEMLKKCIVLPEEDKNNINCINAKKASLLSISGELPKFKTNN